jgi:hypothetical protein
MTEKNSTTPPEAEKSQTDLGSESSAGYITAAASVASDSADTERTAAQSARVPVSRSSGIFVLVVLALVVGASIALFLVRESPWLAQKILREHQIQADALASGAPDSPEAEEKNTGRERAAESPVLVPSLPVAPATPPVALLPAIDALLVQRLAQMQQWSAVLRAVPAGPRDPTRELASILSAGRSGPAGVLTDRPVVSAPPTEDSGVGLESKAPVLPSEAPFGRFGQWFGEAVSVTGSFLASLVRIQQVSDASLAGHTQVFFAQVDQRAQSHLMAARLMLIHGQTTLALAELDSLTDLLRRYYEPTEARIFALKGEVANLRDALKDPV